MELDSFVLLCFIRYNSSFCFPVAIRIIWTFGFPLFIHYAYVCFLPIRAQLSQRNSPIWSDPIEFFTEDSVLFSLRNRNAISSTRNYKCTSCIFLPLTYPAFSLPLLWDPPLKFVRPKARERTEILDLAFSLPTSGSVTQHKGCPAHVRGRPSAKF